METQLHTLEQVFYLLNQTPPFSFLPKPKLRTIAESVETLIYEVGTYVFQQSMVYIPKVWILASGQVEISIKEEDAQRLIDICEEGDVFGVRAVLSHQPYSGNAYASEKTVLYAITEKLFLELMAEYPQFSSFFAAGFAAGMPIVRETSALNNQKQAQDFVVKSPNNKNLATEEDILLLNPNRKPIVCTYETSLRQAAELMTRNKVGSIIVTDAEQRPLGIITNTDFTRKVGAKGLSLDTPVGLVMSSPVLTIKPNITVAQFIINTMRYKVRHLVVTNDGTPETPVVGILSQHDALLTQSNNPAVIAKRIMRSNDILEIAKLRDKAEKLVVQYLEQELSINFISEIITQINDVLIHKAIELSQEELETMGVMNPNLRFAWMSLGSEGRGEQMLRTDQDNAIIYEDPHPELMKVAETYFLGLGEKVVDKLIASGFARCPGNIMASNVKCNQTLTGWKSEFSKWINTPTPEAILNTSIFFDYRASYGNTYLTEVLTDHIFEELDRLRGGFLAFLAKNAVESPPPLSFFRNFVVERSGTHKNQFDIKRRSMMPLTDAARVLTLHHKIKGVQNTFRRYDKLTELMPSKTVFEEAAMAYEILIRFRALNGFKHNDSGRYIVPEELNKIEKQLLRSTFGVIETVQLFLKQEFNLSYS